MEQVHFARMDLVKLCNDLHLPTASMPREDHTHWVSNDLEEVERHSSHTRESRHLVHLPPSGWGPTRQSERQVSS